MPAGVSTDAVCTVSACEELAAAPLSERGSATAAAAALPALLAGGTPLLALAPRAWPSEVLCCARTTPASAEVCLKLAVRSGLITINNVY